MSDPLNFAVNIILVAAAIFWLVAGLKALRHVHAGRPTRPTSAAELIGQQIIDQVMRDGNAVTVRPCPEEPGAVIVGNLDAAQHAGLAIADMERNGAEEIRLIKGNGGAWYATGLARH